MKQMGKRNVFWAVMLLFALNSCTKDVQESSESGKQQFVRFTSVVESAYTRAAGSSWSPSDAIGVYMKKNGADLSVGSIVNNGDNVEYFTENGDGNFLPMSDYLSFPNDGSKVDFIAYYPYQETINNFIYPVDVMNQAAPEAIDLLYADKLEGITERTNALNLSFSHQLSRLVLHIKSIDGSSLDGLTVSISGVKTQADFMLTSGILNIDDNSKGIVDMHMIKGNGLMAEAILLPEGELSNVKLIFKQAGKTHEQALDAVKFEKGRVYTYTVNFKNGQSHVDPEAKYAKWRETPLITERQLDNPDIMYVVHDMPNSMKDPVSKKTLRNYCLLYDTNLKFAYWVAYPLFADAIKKETGRTDAWDYDPSISRNLQADLSTGFNGGAVYDRGHQLPSADRTCDKPTNKTTFYYSNMTPQIGKKMNQTIWAALENKVRAWVSGTDTLFVVTGAMPPESGTIERQKGMAVPAYYFKALARKSSGVFSTIAFKMDNKAYPNTDFMSTAMSVKDLEQLTGFTFFPTLDAEAKKLDLSKWQ